MVPSEVRTEVNLHLLKGDQVVAQKRSSTGDMYLCTIWLFDSCLRKMFIVYCSSIFAIVHCLLSIGWVLSIVGLLERVECDQEFSLNISVGYKYQSGVHLPLAAKQFRAVMLRAFSVLVLLVPLLKTTIA